MHASPAVKDTVWRNYRLIATQWVGAADPMSPDPGDPERIPDLAVAGRIFPAAGVVNATIETYSQRSSCLDCHQTAAGFRFIFFPLVRAHPAGKVP